MRRLTKAQVRRAHIAAQGLARPRPPGRVDIRHVRRAIDTMGVLQIDSVNVVERAHQLTLFSRLGPYDNGLLWRMMEQRELFEYWVHVASFARMEDWPYWRHKMDRFAAGDSWKRVKMLMEKAPGYIESVYRQVADRGPLTMADLDDPGERDGPWWGWADGKVALEHLFAAGKISVAHRKNFTRHYDVAERIVPERIRELPPVSEEESLREMLRRAAERMVVGTAPGLADYYRLPIIPARRVLAEMVESGELVEVEVAGWSEPTFMDPNGRIPRSVEARALLNPFDPIVWFRDRTEALYDFFYRIEIYVPQPKRIYGYYVFPFLLGDELVGRVDLKADRAAGVLRVPGAFIEEGRDPTRVAREMAAELGEMARWLGLGDISVGRKGNLAAALRKAV